MVSTRLREKTDEGRKASVDRQLKDGEFPHQLFFQASRGGDDGTEGKVLGERSR